MATLALPAAELDRPVSLSGFPGTLLALPAASLTLGFSEAASSPSKGTLGNPVYVQVGTVVVDLTQATLVGTDPAVVSGPSDAPSEWISFTVDSDYEMTLTMDDSAAPSEMEVWVGPSYTQLGANVRLVAWTGVHVLDAGGGQLAVPRSLGASLPPVASASFPKSLTAAL